MRELVFKQRDRKRTETKILLALKEVIEQHGLDKVGVNLVADTSGFNKALIYRYFGDINGLVEEYIKFFIKNEPYFRQMESGSGSSNEVLKIGLMQMLHDLKTDKHLRTLLKWEVQYGKSALRTAYTRGFQQIIEKSESLSTDVDISAVIALLCSGIYYLALINDEDGTFFDVNLSSDKDWKRIEDMIKMCLDKLLG